MDQPGPQHAFDQLQFEDLFNTYFQLLCRFARQYVHDLDAAQEICQKVFIALWEKRQDIDPAKSIKTYLFTAVKNRCLNYLRDNKKYRSQVLDLDCGDFDMAFVEEQFAADELKARVERALGNLPGKCRVVFELSRFQHKKYQDIADELGISQKTVEAHMSKALKSLRLELQDYFLLWMFLLKYFF